MNPDYGERRMAKVKITLTKTWEKEIDGDELGDLLDAAGAETSSTDSDEIHDAIKDDLVSDPTVLLDITDTTASDWTVEVLDPSNSNAKAEGES
jgi:hypothetical protein